MSFSEFEAAIVSSALKTVARHWNEARGARRMPGWNDIKPSAIAAHLPIVWSYKYDRSSDSFTGRLAGERISTLFGSGGVRGRPLAEGFPPDRYAAALARFKKVLAGPALMRGNGLLLRHFDRYGFGERIIMPLADYGVDADGIFGATEYDMKPVPLTPKESARGEVEDWYALD